MPASIFIDADIFLKICKTLEVFNFNCRICIINKKMVIGGKMEIWLNSSRRISILLCISFLINIIFFTLGSIFIVKKGGVSFILSIISLKSIKYTSSFSPYYLEKKSVFETYDNNEAGKVIVFIGDSITERCEWNELFNNTSIINRGIGSDDTFGILNRLDSIVKLKPKKVFIMIGINDLGKGRKIQDICNNYRDILKMLDKESPNTQLYIQSVLPINHKIDNKLISNESINKLNLELESLAKLFKVNYVDLHKYLADKDNKLDTKYTNDGVHLNGSGYLVWKKVINEFIND